jgi:hypothetical protein
MSSRSDRKRLCVFTVLTGGYEPLNEQPAARHSDVAFICLTDDPALTSETWEIRRFIPIFPGDPIRSARTVKLRPFDHLPEFDQSLYIDNSVLLRGTPELLFEAADLSSGLCLPLHGFYASLLDKFAAIARDHLDDPARIAEQLAAYMDRDYGLLMAPPFWTGLLLRDHGNPALRAAMDIWLAYVYRFSRRDELSAPMAFQQAGLTPGTLAIDHQESRFHQWPQFAGRQTALAIWHRGAAEAELSACRVEREALRLRLQQSEHEHAVLLQATTWRMLAPLRGLVQRLRGQQT